MCWISFEVNYHIKDVKVSFSTHVKSKERYMLQNSINVFNKWNKVSK